MKAGAFAGALLVLVATAGASPAAVAPAGLIAYSSGGGSLSVASLQGTNARTLFESDSATMQALDVSPDGNQVLALEYAEEQRLVLVPVAGGLPVPVAGTDGAGSGSFSPDGARLVFSLDDSSSETLAAGIYTVGVSGGMPKSLTATPSKATDSLPAYSRDGTKIAFVRDSYDDETVSLELMPSSGGASKTIATRVAPDIDSGGRLSFSPDGTTIAFAGDLDEPGIFTVRVAGGDPTQLTSDFDYWPSFSADGATIYFSRDSGSTNADGNAAVPVAPVAIDVFELWTMKKDGSGAAVVAEGDFEHLAIAALATSDVPSPTGTNSPATPAKEPTAKTAPKVPAGIATSIAVKAKGSRYTVTWKGTARSWTVTLKVGTKTVSAKVKGSAHSRVFVLRGAHGKASARVKST